MELEQIVNKALMPFKVVDGVVKIGHDAIASLAVRKGIDRFTLAKCGGIGAGIFSATAGGLLAFSDSFRYSTPVLIGGGVLIPFLFYGASERFRDYFSKHKEFLDKDLEDGLSFFRFARITLITAGGAGLALGFTGLIPPMQHTTYENVATAFAGITYLSETSAMYFVDGDHSRWDKAKKVYHAIADRIPKISLPAKRPVPEPTMSYSVPISAEVQ